jgi:hypothetical protein
VWLERLAYLADIFTKIYEVIYFQFCLPSTMYTDRQEAYHKDITCDMGRETTLTSFKNIINEETPFAVTRKASQFPRNSTHLIMAEQAETCNAPMNFKKDLFRS